MERQSIIDALKAHRSDLVACGVAHLALFGSRMRGEERAESDLDILIDVDPGHEPVSLIDLAGMCGLIRDITGLEAAPIERHMLARHPDLARRIADDIVEVF